MPKAQKNIKKITAYVSFPEIIYKNIGKYQASQRLDDRKLTIEECIIELTNKGLEASGINI